MLQHWHCRGSAVLLVALGVALGGACSSVTTGVDSCRQIESVRCTALATCDKDTFVGTPESCTRFYDIQCGRGLVDGAREPSSAELKACTDRIATDCNVARDPLSADVCSKFLTPPVVVADTAVADTAVADTTDAAASETD